jgi:hypothetical protein
MDRQVVHAELERARQTFHHLVEDPSDEELARRSAGTRWTNRQLLFHMLLGYLIIRALRRLVWLFGHLPPGAGRGYARLLNAGTVPFDAVNYAGSALGGSTLSRRRMLALFDTTVAALHRRLDGESDTDLARGMHYPTRWDPFFTDVMTLHDVYRFPTRHFDFHRAQLTLDTLALDHVTEATMTTAPADRREEPGPVCWCCGRPAAEFELVRLGAHPGVGVCDDCTRVLRRRSAARHDHRHPSALGLVRQGVGTIRNRVVAHGWHDRGRVGVLLRRLDRHLP